MAHHRHDDYDGTRPLAQLKGALFKALRQTTALKAHYLHTAGVLAARIDRFGAVICSYNALAHAAHFSRATAIRHPKALEHQGILEKLPPKPIGPRRHAKNCYVFVLPLTFPQGTAHPYSGSRIDHSASFQGKMPPNFSSDLQKRNKEDLLRDIAERRKGLEYLTQGSERYQDAQDAITHLETLLAGGAS